MAADMAADPVAARNRRGRWTIPLVLLALLGGFLLGHTGWIREIGRDRGGPSPGRLMNHLAVELDLSEEQETRLRTIVDSLDAEASAFREESLRRHRELRRRFREQIRGILDAGQRERFDTMARDADRHHRGRNRQRSRRHREGKP